ncbi:ABC transporter ATP-binding protein [Aeromicrobium sp. CTD01-1L150]|uniref:ABC transporter ATP-binding protein n=1 Tax=Aeromicrobium sp. CTD01-1L150 TaxID=3341830 RepID=UPI0035C039A2
MIEVSHLSRSYGESVVVDDISFQVRPGRTTGFVGANGAGKTTTMRMIMGVLAPSAGEVLWNGAPVTAQVRRSFGYMPEERGLYPRAPIAEQLVYFARLHGLSRAQAGERTEELLEHFSLSDRADDILDALSLGNQQRVQIAASLVHRPTALVLDEPFSGLDPVAVDSMVALLAREAAGLPLLFSSHQLDLVERLCDDIVILASGRVVAAGPVEELRGQGADRYRVELLDQDAAWLRDVRGLRVRDVDGTVALVDLDGIDAAELARLAVERGPVLEVARARPPLSEVFREVAR